MKYVFPAIFRVAVEGGYCIEFPDIKSAVTQGNDLYDALCMAEDVLNLTLMTMEDDGEKIPLPTVLAKVEIPDEEFTLREGSFVAPIKADTDAYRKFLEEQKTSSPPEKISA